MITEERFIEIMRQDGLNEYCARKLYPKWKKTAILFEEMGINDQQHEQCIHDTNKVMRSSAPTSFLINSN